MIKLLSRSILFLLCAIAMAITGGCFFGSNTSPTVGTVGYIGCFKDTSDYDLNGFLERSRNNTPEACTATCRAKNFAYAAVQYGESCLCGNSYGKYGTATNCDYSCTGATGKICGGYNANSVYATGLSVLGLTPTKTPNSLINSSDSGNISSYMTPTPTQTPDPVAGRWTLDSVTAVPENKSGWTYNAQSSSVRYDVYNGDKHDFQWTKPPTQIDAAGFTISFSTQCHSQPNNVCASLIGASGTGIESDGSSNDRKAEANGKDGSIGRGEKSVTFRPAPDAKELQVEVGLGWGDVRFIYKYRRVN